MADAGGKDKARAAIVTTLRHAGRVIDSFLAYHRAIGFEHFYLFFDDAADPDLARIAALPFVTAVPHDASLRERWRALAEFAEQGPHIETEVMARQVLNVALAMAMARADGIAWLLGIDADELFASPRGTVAEHFAHAAEDGIEVIGFLNFEAVPEKEEIGDYFREVTLFKVQPALLPGPRYTMEQLRAVCRSVPQFRPNFYHFYSCGKSAVRLDAAGIAPAGVHSFKQTSGAPLKAMQSRFQSILHYPCCGFENFWTKYATLGRFADAWWSKHDIASSIGTFHLEARDIVMGDLATAKATDGREAARAFYRRLVLMDDARQTEALIAGGFLARLWEPQAFLLR